MGLRLKFNLVLLVVFALGLGVTGWISYDLLHKNAREEVLRNAGVMMEAALSMRGYTNAQIRPLVPYNDAVFHPQSVPAYSATEIMNATTAAIHHGIAAAASLLNALTGSCAIHFRSRAVRADSRGKAQRKCLTRRATPDSYHCNRRSLNSLVLQSKNSDRLPGWYRRFAQWHKGTAKDNGGYMR